MNVFTYKSPSNLCNDVGTILDIQCIRRHPHISYRHWPHSWSLLYSGNGNFRCFIEILSIKFMLIANSLTLIITYSRNQHLTGTVDDLYKIHTHLCPRNFDCWSRRSQRDISKHIRRACSCKSVVDRNLLHALHTRQCPCTAYLRHLIHIHFDNWENWCICSRRLCWCTFVIGYTDFLLRTHWCLKAFFSSGKKSKEFVRNEKKNLRALIQLERKVFGA